MIGNADISSHLYISERITFLEETNRRHMAILDMLASSGDFQGELSRATDVGGIFCATVAQVRRLIDCRAAGCLESLDDGTFELSAYDPPEFADQLRGEIDDRVMDGSFAWALNRNQAVLIPGDDNQTLLMQVIATRSRIRGMFVAVLPGAAASVDAAALNALSIVLYTCAYSLESASLYMLLREQTSHLEERVQQRTAELEELRTIAEKANQAKSEFLANMSHEIRTPMNAIMGLTELILDGGIEATQQEEYLRMVRDSSENLLSIINDLLDISKIEAGKLELEEVPLRLRTSVGKLLKPLIVRAAQKNLRIVLSVGEDVPDELLGDEGKLRQILINLVGNAVKFSNSGDIYVSVGFERQTPDGLYLQFRIVDNGIGIAPDVLERIFNPFEQADSTTSKQFGGTGLGLAICKRLVALMDGDIGVESQPPHGSTFWFTCRFRPDTQVYEADLDTPQDLLQAEEMPAARSLSVLLADDVEFNRILATALLERAGHRVLTACNGIETVELFTRNRFDVVLMDVQMPVMDGLQATQAIRRIEEASGHRTPIVALTAYASEVDRRICRQAGMDDYLSKPFKSSDLQAVLGRCCGAFALEKRLIDDTDEAGSVGGMADKSGEQVFDYVNLLNRLGGRRDTIPRFLELFRNGIAHQRQELESAASSGDPEAVRVTAHAIKGAAANIAALRVYEVAARIERKSYEGLFEAAVALIPELYDELSRFENSSRELFP